MRKSETGGHRGTIRKGPGTPDRAIPRSMAVPETRSVGIGSGDRGSTSPVMQIPIRSVEVVGPWPRSEFPRSVSSIASNGMGAPEGGSTEIVAPQIAVIPKWQLRAWLTSQSSTPRRDGRPLGRRRDRCEH
jgi:hypothetical protein